MSRLLTQAEVDALLAFDDAPSRRAGSLQTPFDLRAPVLLAGERLTLVQTACESVARVFAAAVGECLGAERAVRGVFAGLMQQPAAVLLATLAPGAPVGMLEGADGDLLGAVVLHPELALALIERLQGGPGRPQRGPRRFSPVELTLFEELLRKLTEQLDRETPLRPLRAGGVEATPLGGRLAQRGGALAAAQLRLTTPVGEAVCRLFMTPALANRLVAQAPVKHEGGAPAALLEALQRAPVALTPVIIGATVRVADLARLAPGDVLQLDVSEQQPIGLRFNGALLARAVLRGAGPERRLEIRELAPDATNIPLD